MIKQKKYSTVPSGLDQDNLDNLDDMTELLELSPTKTTPLDSRSNSLESTLQEYDNQFNIKDTSDHVTEQQFLTLLLNSIQSTSSSTSTTSTFTSSTISASVRLKIKQRLLLLKANDDASRLESLSFARLALYRSPAILLTLSIEMIVGIIISRFEQTLKIHMLLTSFMPILSSVSGNIGLQASTATLRALATNHKSHTSRRDCLSSLRKEVSSAMVISLCVGLVLIVVSSIWSGSLGFGLVTGLSVIISSTIGGGIGSMSPFLFKNLNIDPAITAGPFETGVQDIIGITLYLSFAYFLL